MDKNEHSLLSSLPAHALALHLARTPIKMHHSKSWRIDKLNPDHDLVICLTGSANYLINNENIHLKAGGALLIPKYHRFRGQHGGGDEAYTGIAQHFSLELFGREDAIQKMRLCSHVQLNNWDVLEPLVRHYRKNHEGMSTRLAAHHEFMVLLLSFIEQALLGWRTEESEVQSEDHISLQIMLVASRLSADLLSEAAMVEVMNEIPYNKDYFRRAFRDRMGMTPKKYRELKRMEFAIHRLGVGLTVKEVAGELGYNDVYYFSRLFKQYMGASPSQYRWRSSEQVGE